MVTLSIDEAVAGLGSGPLTEAGLVEHVHPLFSRVLGRDEIYLANHSLGRPLDRMGDDVRAFVDLWYSDMDSAWGAWMGEMGAYRASVARLIGCARTDAVVHKLSAGQGLRAVLNAAPGTACPRVVATRGEFDSVDTILKAYQQKGRAAIDWVDADAEGLFDADRIIERITPEADLVVVSLVYFNSGQVLEGIDEIVQAAHRAGAAAVLDTYHATGTVPWGFDDTHADFAIGGNYKYTRGGPGAGWLSIRADLLDDPRWSPIDTGWFAKDAHFDFARSDEMRYAQGGDGWNESTPAPIVVYQAKAGLEFVLAMGVDRLRAYSLEQQSVLAELLRGRGVPVRELTPRGAFLCADSSNHARACEALKARGVNTDSRTDPLGRGIVRFCPDVLSTREEMERAATIAGEVWAG